MLPGGEAAMAAMYAAFGESVGYAGAGLAAPTDVMVIWSDDAGGPFQGAGNTTRTITMEIRRGALPERPGRADRIARKTAVWKPNQVVDRDDIDSYVVTLESAT